MDATQRGGELTSAGLRWAEGLAGWALPREILAQACESPWSMPPGLLRAEPEPVDTLSTQFALAALPAGGAVLDVGCGAARGERGWRWRPELSW